MMQTVIDEWKTMDPDPRVDGYLLMDSFWPTAAISLTYTLGTMAWVKLAAPKKSPKANGHANGSTKSAASTKPAFDTIKCLMIVYNAIMVVLSSFMVYETLAIMYHGRFTLGCVPYLRTDDPVQLRFVRLGWLFYFTKFIELLDTLFFLLRGKFDQVSFLHVFHHGAMPPSIWWGIKYAPGGLVFMFPLANSFVHVIMYAYYGLSALGLHRYLWWKKYLTLLQMIQFCIFIVHQGQVLIPFNASCPTPKIFPLAIVIYAAIFLVLFGNFYVQAYWKKRRLAKIEADAVASAAASKKTTNGHAANGRQQKRAKKE